MMLELGDDGVVSKVNEDDLIYVDKNELEELIDKYTHLEEENEKLKKQMERLYNYFVDWHGDIMGANQFSEMWDNVKEDKKWEKRW